MSRKLWLAAPVLALALLVAAPPMPLGADGAVTGLPLSAGTGPPALAGTPGLATEQTPGLCSGLSCPALFDLCLKDGDQRACALYSLCC